MIGPSAIIYDIILRVGQHLNNLQDDFQTIFQTFNLPSWLASIYDVRILSRDHTNTNIPFFHTILKPNHLQHNSSMELFFFQTGNSHDTYTITYYVQNNRTPIHNNNKIVITFSKDAVMKHMNIHIDDTEGFLKQMLSTPQEQHMQSKREVKPNELQYPYIEPENVRAKYQNDRLHFHLAFQGGGSKGIAYMGAYKALRDINPDYQITSVIGSSAGGMISLGIAAGGTFAQLYEICKKMQRIPFDRTIKSVDELTPEKLRQYAEIKAKLKRALHDYGLICNEVFDLLMDEVLTSQVIEKVFEILSADNQSIAQMLKIEVEDEIIEQRCCFSRVVHSTERVNRLLNYYGLIQGRLLLGKELENVSLAILKQFLEAKLVENHEKFVSVMKLQGLNSIQIMKSMDKLAEQLTMDKFYSLNGGVQFTCTSVDIDSQLLRFFNHKTTPHLPVSKAILMTGSFPIAFESMRWKKEWGKYYIHYSNRRREIDLTGHQFTDGGMLANFPIIFLDNQQMRPIYFSHRQNSKTKLFGFGLEQIPEQPTIEAQKQKDEKIERLRGELSDLILKHLPKLKFLYYQMRYVPKPETIPVEDMIPIGEIPIVGFMYKLLSTYFYANDNLVAECFDRSIYFIPVHYSMAKALKAKDFSLEEIASKTVLLKDSLINMYNLIAKQNYNMQSFLKNIYDAIAILDIRSATTRDILEIKTLVWQNLIEFVLYEYDQIKNAGELPQTNECQKVISQLSEKSTELIERLKDVCRKERLTYCDTTKRDTILMREICLEMADMFSLKKIQCQLQTKIQLKAHLEKFGESIKEKQLKVIENIIHTLMNRLYKPRSSMKEQPFEMDESQRMDINDSELVHLLSKFYHSYQRKSYQEQFSECRDRIRNIDNLILNQQLVFDAQKRKMGTYIEDMLRRRKSNNIHLVFQSVGEYNKMSFEIYKLVNQYIFMHENTKSAYYCQQITDMILRDDQNFRASNSQFTINDLVRKVAVKCDLLAYVEENFNRLWNQPEIKLDLGVFTITEASKRYIIFIMNQISSNVCKITSLTCSSMHSYFGFLLTTGFKQERIEREIEQMRDYFETDVKQIQQEFDRKDWVLPFKCKVRELQDLLWNARYNLFEQLETAAREKKLITKLQEIRIEFENSKEMIMNSYSDILEFLMASQMKANHEKSFEEYVASRMALRVEQRDYLKDNRQISSDTKELMDIFVVHFYEQLRFLVLTLSPQTMKEFLSLEQDPNKRQAMWKGVIISRFLKCDKLKKKVQDVLKEMNLPKDIKLKDFHEVIPRKLELTFTVVDTTNKKISFINCHTFPEMPVWAAVVTGSSFPVLFPEIHSNSQWIQRIDSKTEDRYLKLFFSDGQYHRPPIFTSGNLLSSLPLELLSNKKIQETCFNGKDYTFLNFGVTRQKKEHVVITEFHRRFMTMGEIISIGVKKLTKALFGVRQMIEMNAGLITKGSLIETYLLSHDNLILQLYYKGLLQLPVRLGTLQFYKLGKKIDGDITFSDKTIDETYYSTKEKFTEDKITYIEARLIQGKLRLRFLSKERSNKDIRSNYKIEFKLASRMDWQPLRDQQIFIPTSEKQINIKFYYVEEKDKNAPYRPLLESGSQTVVIRESEYRLDLGTFFSVFTQFCGIFQFPYSKVFNHRLKLIGAASKSVLKNIQRKVYAENVFHCMTVVQLFKTGLYCELCTSALNFLKAQDRTPFEEVCSKCKNRKLIKFVCNQQIEPCIGKYCFKCAKNQVILRTPTQLLCFNHHEFTYIHRKQVLMKTKAVPSRCDLCLGYTQSYYQDSKCGIKICQACCAQFTVE